jgi:hypothetical protein
VQTALAAVLIAVACSESPARGGTSVRVRCHNRAATALDILVPGYGGPASLTLLRGVSDHPWLVRREAGGSDVHFWWVPLHARAGRLWSLVAKPIETSSQDAICADARRPNRITVVRHVWGSDVNEWHYAPHRYAATSYVLDAARGRFVKNRTRTTKERHASWAEAAGALQLDCHAVSEELSKE